MATTTGLVLLQRLSERIGDYISLTASNGTTATVVDTDLDNYTEDSGGIQGWVKIIGASGAAPEGEIRRIKAGTSGYATGGTVTVNFAFSATVESGDTYELHRFDPVTKRTAINAAIRSLYPSNRRRGLYLYLRDESLVVDNLLSNSGFETGVSGNSHPSWTRVGGSTITDETTIVRHLTKSAKIVASGVGPDGQDQTPQVNISKLIDKTVYAQFWVYATTANWGRIRVDFDDGTTFANSDYHTGQDEWQLLKIAATIPKAATQLGLRLEVASSGTAYFDAGWMAVGPLYKYTIPTSFVQGPHAVEMQYNEDNLEGPYDPLPEGGVPTMGRTLRLHGMGRLTEPTTDTATTEIDGGRVDLIVAEAARILFSGMVEGDPGKLFHQPTFWEIEVERLRTSAGIGMPRMSAEIPRSNWKVEEDSSGKYLVFTQSRG